MFSATNILAAKGHKTFCLPISQQNKEGIERLHDTFAWLLFSVAVCFSLVLYVVLRIESETKKYLQIHNFIFHSAF